MLRQALPRHAPSWHALLPFVVALCAGCAPDAAPPAVAPAPLPEIVQAPPAPGMVWVPGCWHRDGEGYVWLPGHWESPAR